MDVCDEKTGFLSATFRAVYGDRFKIESKLGAGTIGEVYKATDTVLDRTVALKKIRTDYFSSGEDTEELRLSFLREAQEAAKLHHPNIVTINDIISTPDLSLIVMDFIDGTTLRDKLNSEKSLSLGKTVRILSQVADALEHAHSREVIHRDIKPANIIISGSGLVKVTDFGTARMDSGEHTIIGGIWGTPDYMSPEHARGETVDERSDLFCLGCVLYQCLAGEKPFRSRSATGILLRIVSEDPDPIDREDLLGDGGVESFLKQALAKDPSERFQTAFEFGQALRALLKSDSSLSVPTEDELSTPEDELSTPEEPPDEEFENQDSVADILMIDARSSADIESFLVALQDEERPFHVDNTSMLEFRNVSPTPEEAYILSRVDGQATPADIFAVSPLSESDTARALLGFLRTGIICFEDHDQNTSGIEPEEEQQSIVATSSKESSETSEASDSLLNAPETIEPAESELESSQANEASDSLSNASEANEPAESESESSLANEASDSVSSAPEANEPVESESESSRLAEHAEEDVSLAAAGQTSREPDPDDLRNAEEMFQQAMRAYESEDYWRTIELCQRAVEIDGQQPDHFHLLGLALLQNQKWKHVAEKNLRRASELDPGRPEFLATLGELYLAEGLSSRARRTFDQLRAIDPSYPIPEGDV